MHKHLGDIQVLEDFLLHEYPLSFPNMQVAKLVIESNKNSGFQMDSKAYWLKYQKIVMDTKEEYMETMKSYK